MASYKVLIVDDHKIIREGVKALLKGAEGIEIVGDADSGKEAIEFIATTPVDVVLMDLGMPEMSGAEATKIIFEKFSDVYVLALTMHDDEAHIIEMLDAGASGYILKTINKTNLVESIKTVGSGQPYFSSEASQKIVEHFMKSRTRADSNGDKDPVEQKITKREKEVLKLIAEENTNHEIAKKLHLSYRTVDSHRRNLLQKLNVKNTAGLVKYALKTGLLS
ncbi:response regulator transcription factor [Fulvivirgaceae bacterium BMA10]|uniref:Response regulator transcription factor n=1 Tax=Splendidivirga corallicola TaxID=3051826 RepID=A0ABT8KT50_9BACT|nr:response regulator transcription factor [Fulvivirgaceae bacterium BMA10]